MRQLFVVLLLVSQPVLAQTEWDWGWSEPPLSWEEDALLQTIEVPKRSFAEYAIGYYQKEVVPVMDRPCPSWPACSMYTRYSMARFGFVPGLLMGVERMFIREHQKYVEGESTAFTFLLNGQPRVYDPPDTNVATLLRDWRQLHPDYRSRFDTSRGPNQREHSGLGVHVPAR